MTELLYFSSDEFVVDAMVRTCLAMPAGYAVTLDRTIFHPQGGGQPSDVGYIGAACVTKVVQKNGDFFHYIDAPLEIGQVKLHVDMNVRLLHSRLHTAGHLIGHAVAALGYAATRAHHWPNDSRVDISSVASVDLPISIPKLQLQIDDLIAQNLPRIIQLHDGHRTVGFGSLSPFSCGGTHVLSTGEVGRCILGDISNDDKGIRIRYAVE
jgi:alanyl-tRNA synthetase